MLTSKAFLFKLDPSLGFALLTSSLGSRSNKISYLVSTRLNWNEQVCIITFLDFQHFLILRICGLASTLKSLVLKTIVASKNNKLVYWKSKLIQAYQAYQAYQAILKYYVPNMAFPTKMDYNNLSSK